MATTKSIHPRVVYYGDPETRELKVGITPNPVMRTVYKDQMCFNGEELRLELSDEFRDTNPTSYPINHVKSRSDIRTGDVIMGKRFGDSEDTYRIGVIHNAFDNNTAEVYKDGALSGETELFSEVYAILSFCNQE